MTALDSGYRLFAAVEVAHEFYADPAAARLRWLPSAGTARWLHRVGCVVRTDGAGLAIYRPGDRPPPAGRPRNAPAAGPLLLKLALQSEDPLFASVTEAGATEAGIDFSAEGAKRDRATGVWLLARARQDQRRGAAAQSRGLGVQRLRVVLPLNVLEKEPGRRYRLVLASRATVWKYLLLGDWSAGRLQIVDAAKRIDFGAATEESLADGRPALAIRSTIPIPLRQRPDYRFQLVERGAGGSRAAPSVLLRRLPMAGSRALALERIDGESTLVSEIFVQR